MSFNKINTIKYFESITSTNDVLKCDTLTNFDNIMVYIANEQTNGRGRKGRSFYSPKDDGIYFSLSFPISISNSNLYTITAAVSVAKELRKLNFNPKIKWVNDILINNKKVCGILTEAISKKPNSPISNIIIGIGINLSNSTFPAELKDIAIDLGLSKSIITKDFKINLATKISENILKNLNNPDYILNEYKKNLFTLNKQVEYMDNNKKINGIAIDINNDGNLIIKDISGKLYVINSGEVIIKK